MFFDKNRGNDNPVPPILEHFQIHYFFADGGSCDDFEMKINLLHRPDFPIYLSFDHMDASNVNYELFEATGISTRIQLKQVKIFRHTCYGGWEGR